MYMLTCIKLEPGSQKHREMKGSKDNFQKKVTGKRFKTVK